MKKPETVVMMKSGRVAFWNGAKKCRHVEIATRQSNHKTGSMTMAGGNISNLFGICLEK